MVFLWLLLLFGMFVELFCFAFKWIYMLLNQNCGLPSTNGLLSCMALHCLISVLAFSNIRATSIYIFSDKDLSLIPCNHIVHEAISDHFLLETSMVALKCSAWCWFWGFTFLLVFRINLSLFNNNILPHLMSTPGQSFLTPCHTQLLPPIFLLYNCIILYHCIIGSVISGQHYTAINQMRPMPVTCSYCR